MMVIIKARPGTIAPPVKRVGVDLAASVTIQTVVRRLQRTRQGCPGPANGATRWSRRKWAHRPMTSPV